MKMSVAVKEEPSQMFRQKEGDLTFLAYLQCGGPCVVGGRICVYFVCMLLPIISWSLRPLRVRIFFSPPSTPEPNNASLIYRQVYRIPAGARPSRTSNNFSACHFREKELLHCLMPASKAETCPIGLNSCIGIYYVLIGPKLWWRNIFDGIPLFISSYYG